MRGRMRWLGVALCSGGLGLAPAAWAQERPSIPANAAGQVAPQVRSEAPPREGAEEREERRGEEPIETDRDSFTPSTRTAGDRRLIMESAYSFLDNRGVKETHSFPELLFRYGVGERLELRVGWNYEVGGAGNDVSGGLGAEGRERRSGASEATGLEREYRLSYGLTALVSEQDEWLPQSAVIVQGLTPTGGEATATQFTATYVFGWTLPEDWKLDAALRYGTGSDRGDRFDVWAPSVVLKVPLGERWNVHGEYFALFSHAKAEDFVKHFLSPGVHFLITPDLEIGVRVGWGLNEQSARFFGNVGVGWRF